MRIDISVRKTWSRSFELLINKPVLLLPFFAIAFLELMALEVIYFSGRRPLSLLAGPVVAKFFGRAFTHYPDYMIVVPKLFYYAQLTLYIFVEVCLLAVFFNIFRNIKAGLPLKANVFVRNVLNSYFSFVTLAVITAALLFLLNKADIWLYLKLSKPMAKFLPKLPPGTYVGVFTALAFISQIFFQTFIIGALPLMVIHKRSLPGALGRSVLLGLRNFFPVFMLLVCPAFIYLPVNLLKNYSNEIALKLFPESVVIITAAGILLALFVESFIAASIAHVVSESEKAGSR